MMAFASRYRAVVVPPLLFVLAACTPAQYGAFGRVVSLPAMPDVDCVEATLRATPGVTFVNFRPSSSLTLSLSQGTVRSNSYNWVYRVEDFVGNVNFRFEENKDGGEFHHSLTRSSNKLSESEQAHVEALVAHVNASLEAACGIPVSNGEA